MFSEMARHPVIRAEEENALWHRYRILHDRRAGEQLVLANLRFVVMVARQYRARGVPMGDLIQEGNIGLIKAVQRFRPDMGFRLTSYAVWWIRAQIQGFILSSYSVVKLGTSRAQRKVFFCLARARRELRASGGACGAPGEAVAEDLEELARKLGIKVAELDEILRRIEGRDVSLDSSDLLATPDDEGGYDWVAEPGAEEGDDGVRTAALRAALDRLAPRDRHVVEARFLCSPPVKLRALATELGLTTARVYQLEVRALQRLREALVADSATERASDERRGKQVVSLAPIRARAAGQSVPRRQKAGRLQEAGRGAGRLPAPPIRGGGDRSEPRSEERRADATGSGTSPYGAEAGLGL